MPFGGACACLTAPSENIICIGGSSGTDALSNEVLGCIDTKSGVTKNDSLPIHLNVVECISGCGDLEG